ncbi:MAG: baseplate J/gp47 family protein [Chloroflexota bacterium]|nr:baseplate J/gp47 family protein [Chloroflexota bacterium]
MATIVYLEPEDEITSAATRIRTAGGTRVGLVLPFGSRVATSRINFRLLAREAQASGRRLDIVAPDTSARALAASAGLPVFSSVGEYEAALEMSDEIAGIVDEPAATTAATTSAPALGAAAEPAPVERFRPRARVPALDPAQQAELDEIVARSRQATEDRPRRRGPGVGVIISFLVLGLAVIVSVTAAAVVLPSAEITVTPRIELVGPISITVTADPAASAVDPGTRVIPAQTLEIPVSATGEFTASGKRVEETRAQGGVRWTNCDPSDSYTIPKGTLVRTTSGVAFGIDEQVFLPVAPILAGNVLDCQTSEVSVTASKSGPAGNVDAGAIRVIPASYNRNLIKVTNAAPTTGGVHTEFPKVAASDVEAALKALRADIEAQFAVEVENPERVPAGATVFPETAVAGDPIPNVDPATLVGQELKTFTLGMTASGTVLAVDASPVEAIAEAQLTSAITPGYQLVEGSIRIEVGEGTVTEGLVDFPVTGSARQLRPLDAAALEREILGLSEADAVAALAPYGEVAISLWPGWVTSVPTLDQRVTVSLAEPVDSVPTPTPTPSPRPSPASAPGVEPGASEDASGSEPVPSG